MRRYIATRLILSILTILITVSLIYLLLNYAALFRWTRGSTKLELLQMSWLNYLNFAKGVVTEWDWGTSIRREPVWDLVKFKMWISLRINIIAFIIYVSIGILLGVYTAIRKGSIFDKLTSTISLALGSIPSFIWVFVLMIFLGWKWNLVPTLYIYEQPGFFNRIEILIIPILALIIEPISKFIRLVRAEVIEDMQSEYILLLRAKGLKRKQIIKRHTLKNVAVVILPEITTTFIYVLTSSFFIEYFYTINGAANLMLKSIITFGSDTKFVSVDTSVVTAISAFYIVFIVVTALIIDIIWALLDPRIKINGTKTN